MNKGFTLIELLIVIAIIGILAGIVITSFANETDRASNAVVQLDVSTLKILAIEEQISSPTPTGQEICTNVNASWKEGSFSSTVYGPPVVFEDSLNVGSVYCRSHGKRWVIYGVVLNGTTPEIVCADSQGNFKTTPYSLNIRRSPTEFSC